MTIGAWRRRRRREHKDASLRAWLRSGWADESRWRALFHYISFGYFAHDLTIPLSTEIFAHHVACTGLTSLSLADLPVLPACTSACFALTTTTLELGSMAYSAANLNTQSATLR
jgi:hypothetical protein